MKKFVIIALVIAAVLIPITAFAATAENGNSSNTAPAQSVKKFERIDPSKLTDAQKKDLEDQHTKMIALQKETINKMVANGTITKEQGDEMLTRIDEREKIRVEKGIVPMPFGGQGGMGKGGPGGKRGGRGGCCNGNELCPPQLNGQNPPSVNDPVA